MSRLVADILFCVKVFFAKSALKRWAIAILSGWPFNYSTDPMEIGVWVCSHAVWSRIEFEPLLPLPVRL